MDTRVYVGNLSKSATQEQLNTLFAQAGVVSSVEIVTDKSSGVPKGFAFVAMADQAGADKAVSMFNDHFMGDSMLKVNIAKPRA